MTQSERFFDCLPECKDILGDNMTAYIHAIATQNRWQEVKQHLIDSLESEYTMEVDHLYAQIPGQQSAKTSATL